MNAYNRDDGPNHELLLKRVVSSASDCVGRRLSAVQYEATASDIASDEWLCGGEVQLSFDDNLEDLHVTCDENAGWPLHFSVRTDRKSYWNKGVLQPLSANHLPLWKSCIGAILTDVAVYGFEQTPCVVVMRIGHTSVAIGSACGGLDPVVFGDGDDILVEPFNSESRAMQGMKLYWTC